MTKTKMSIYNDDFSEDRIEYMTKRICYTRSLGLRQTFNFNMYFWKVGRYIQDFSVIGKFTVFIGSMFCLSVRLLSFDYVLKLTM